MGTLDLFSFYHTDPMPPALIITMNKVAKLFSMMNKVAKQFSMIYNDEQSCKAVQNDL